MSDFAVGQLETNGIHFSRQPTPVKAAERLYLVLRVLHHGDLSGASRNQRERFPVRIVLEKLVI